MANDEVRGFSKEDLKDLITAATTAAVSAAMKPNALEQRKIDEQIAADKRRTMMVFELGKAEEEAMNRRKNGCSHSRYSMAAGKLGGHACAKGQGEWTTGGQMLDRKKAVLICTRCSWTWTFLPNDREAEFIEQSGLQGFPPPTKEKYGDRLLAEG